MKLTLIDSEHSFDEAGVLHVKYVDGWRPASEVAPTLAESIENEFDELHHEVEAKFDRMKYDLFWEGNNV